MAERVGSMSTLACDCSVVFCPSFLTSKEPFPFQRVLEVVRVDSLSAGERASARTEHARLKKRETNNQADSARLSFAIQMRSANNLANNLSRVGKLVGQCSRNPLGISRRLRWTPSTTSKNAQQLFNVDVFATTPSEAAVGVEESRKAVT